MPLLPPFARSLSRTQRSLVLLATSSTLFYAYDEYQANALTRSLRTLWTDQTDAIAAMHERVAHRLHHLCTSNGGLYIKLGQALGMQAAIAPKPYTEAFANIFDAAPPIPYHDIERVFQGEFGMKPEELFLEFDKTSIAAASIAQVHRAMLKDGTPVAVKIQRPAVPKQIEWDLACFKLLMHTYEWLFEIPCVFMSEYIAQQLRLETDFRQEAANAEHTARSIAEEPSLANRVSVPKVYWDLTTKRIMTAEYVSGACRITDTKQLDAWGLDRAQVMRTVIDVFSAMIFKFGWVHCDPHPGNVLVRPKAGKSKTPEIVIIDHGLYVRLTEDFRREYSLLWRSLFARDTDSVEKIAKRWERADPRTVFASSTLLRPTRLKKREPSNDAPRTDFEAQLNMKAQLQTFLKNEQLLPRELIFLSRCQRMMQANNQMLGSPINRIHIIAHWAVIGLADTTDLGLRDLPSGNGVRAFFKNQAQLWTFRFNLLILDLGFFLTKLWQRFFRPDQGFEDLLQKQFAAIAKKDFGIELNDEAFMG